MSHYSPLDTFTNAGKPPANMAAFWQGEVFYKAKKYGICDELRLTELLGFRYYSDAREQVWGDFTLVKHKPPFVPIRERLGLK